MPEVTGARAGWRLRLEDETAVTRGECSELDYRSARNV